MFFHMHSSTFPKPKNVVNEEEEDVSEVEEEMGKKQNLFPQIDDKKCK